MSSELDTIFNKISGWSVEEIQSIMHHEEWTREGENPFEGPGNPPKNSEPLFTDYRNTLKTLLGQDFKVFTTEKISKIIISSTFLLMNDESKVRPKYLSEWMNKKENRANLLQLLETMDKGWSASDQNITKLQLFYALCKQRENSKFKIKKVTWANVTSKWGPKIVMTDGESYYYIFNQRDDFKGRHERYNIAATLGQTEQYKSKYLEEKNHFNLNILKVNATSKCTTLAEYFQNKEMGSEKNESNRKLFERLSEEFFRNELEIKLVVATDELRKILPRLSQEENTNPCLSSVLSPEKEWVIPRTKVEADKQDFFVVHGDEWGGNFLVTESARQVFMIDFEDAIFANANQPETIIRVGGDLSSRIFSPRKNEDQKFHEIGLSIFASIGRLLAAIVQYHARNQELLTKNIKTIIINYVTGFENSLEEKNDILHGDHWTDFKQLILLHAWDWALYWRQKEKQVFPTKHFEEFVKEIKKLLFDGHEDRTDSVPTSLREDTTGPERMPSDNTEGRDEKTIEDRNIERADNDAWNFYVKGDMESAEIGWNDALQTLDASNSSEDKGYFTYWKTKAAYINNDDVSGAIESILQCIEFCKAEEDDAWLMDALLFLAYLRRTAGEIDQARHIIDQIVSLYHGGEFEEEPESLDAEQLLEWPEKRTPYYGNAVLCRIKRQVANFFFASGDLAKSANLFENLMHYYVGVQKHYDVDNARIILGIIKSDLGEYEESDALQNQCLVYRRKEYAKVNDGDTGEITKALRNLGQNAMAWKNYTKAKQYFADCINELRKVPSEIIPEDDLKRFISFNQSLMEKCDSLAEIRRIQIHERDDDRVNLLIEAMERSDSHKHLYVVPILSNKMDRRRALDFSKSLDETDYPAKLNLKIAEKLYNKFLHADEAKRFLNSIAIEDLDQKMKIEVLLMYETVHFMESQDKDELIAYHSSLQQEYSVEYPNILIEIDYKWDDELEQQNLLSLFTDLVGLNIDEQRHVIHDFFESEPSRIARHLFVRIVVDCMQGGGDYRDKLFAGSFILSSNAITKLCLNNLTYLSRYYTDSYNDVHDFLTLAGFSGISYANENRTDKHKLERLQYKLSKLGELYQTRWLGNAELEICNDIFSFITEGLLGNERKKFDAWNSILQKIMDLSNMNSKRYLFSLLHSVMVWDKRLYRKQFLLKSTVRMKELAEILVQWIYSEPNVFSLSIEDYRKRSARWLLEKANVPEHEWDFSIRTDFDDNLD